MRQGNAPIVVGVDGSDNSLRALRWALREALLQAAPVTVVHCRRPHLRSALRPDAQTAAERGSVCMLDNEITAALRNLPIAPTVTPLSIEGRAATVLVDVARDARLLVLGGHGRDGRGDSHGRTAQKCLRDATCPVAVVEGDLGELEAPRVGELDSVGGTR